METYEVIGLMSGTSLDGVDIAYCEFSFSRRWDFKIVMADTIEYPVSWTKRLKSLHKESAEILLKTHMEYGKYLGEIVGAFLHKHKINPLFISSHGHTIFHQPEQGFTFQLGDGNALANKAGFPVICDFRTLDVARGGQGAPLVPVGDKYLFQKYEYCLNLGGIANISYEENNQRIAYDICPANFMLNHLAAETGLKFDDKGMMASSGVIVKSLLDKLNQIEYYSKPYPKSIGREWIENVIYPLLESDKISLNNLLRTFTEHIAIQICRVINHSKKGRVLVTGGGAKNDFLIDCISKKTSSEIIIPQKTIVDYKEAMIFAFLGVLRWRNEINCMSSVTGATEDSCCGSIINV